MKRYYCTYFDRNYLVKALALVESLNRHEKNFELFAICLDEITRVILKRLALPNVTPIPIHEIEQGDFPLMAAKRNRSLVEYYWTLTPTIIMRLLEKYHDIHILTYLDADLYFFSTPNPIFEELGKHSILIHEHRFAPSLMHLEKFGKYNVGLLCFRNDPLGKKVLEWWRQRCIEWCYTHLENGKYGDQLYLNDWPERFEGVAVLQNIGAGVAPWNHEQYEIRTDQDKNVLINNEPLVFYHFHGLVFAHPGVIVPAVHHHPLTTKILECCFLPYVHAMSRGIATLQSVLDGFSFGLTGKDVLTTVHTFISRRECQPIFQTTSIPQIPMELDTSWDCYCSPQMKDFDNITGSSSYTNSESDGNSVGYINLVNSEKSGYLKERRNPKTLNQAGETFFEQGEIENARQAFNHAIALDSDFAPAHNNLGVLYWHTGNVQNALMHLTRAMEIDPSDRDTIMNCGDLLKSLDKSEEARRVYTSYLGNHPEDTEIVTALKSL